MPESFREDLLHYVWRYQLYDFKGLKTLNNESVTILNPGILNVDSGPDFSNARIKINNTVWVGHIEIHIKASDWYQHNHQKDPAYSNVILHVVYDNDMLVNYSNGTTIPTIVLAKRIFASIFINYLKITGSKEWIPCEKAFRGLNQELIRLSLHGFAIKRLEQKVKQITLLYEESDKDLNQVFYALIARYLGGRVNKNSFEKLSKSIPIKILLKYQDRPDIVEALLLGQSGLLPKEHIDQLIQGLINDYLFYQQKHGLQPMNYVEWKFSKMRPAGFPTLRISQLSYYVCQKGFWSIYKSDISFKALCIRLESKASELWDTRYNFKKEGSFRIKSLGKSMIHNLLINAVLPMMFFYGSIKGKDDLKEKVIELLSECNAEMNKIIRGWEKLGLKPNNAFETQALYYLKTQFCDNSYCLYCPIGNQIMRKS